MQQAVPKKIAQVSAELETTCQLLSEKLGQEVETEITGLNNLLSQQDQVLYLMSTVTYFLQSLFYLEIVHNFYSSTISHLRILNFCQFFNVFI